MVTAAELSAYPEEVRDFVTALIANAKTNEDWAKPDLEGGKCFAETIPYVKRIPDGSVRIMDNYERFFDTIYQRSADGVWTIRAMYSDEPAKPYTFEQCMGDAQIMFTG